MSKLQGKVAVVTGASKGIGAAIARQLAADGARVVVNYASSQVDGERVAQSINDAGGEAIAVGANVSRQADIDALFEAAIASYGQVDILVNNAGVFEFAPLETIDEGHFHRQFDLNVLGLILTSQAAARHFGERGGSIVNISSVVSIAPTVTGSVYSATKAAVDAVTKSLAKELGPRGIRVNSVNPGMIATEGTATAGILDSDFRRNIEAATPLGRIGKPEDVAKVVSFFVSDDAAWVTGETLLVSGGQL